MITVTYDGRYLYYRTDTGKQDEPHPDEVASWQEQVLGLNNLDLLRNVLRLAGGDDYEGCITDTGRIVRSMLERELDSRLHQCSYLAEEEALDKY